MMLFSVAHPLRSRLRRAPWLRNGLKIVLVALVGTTSGFIGAYCYYDDLLRPLAHALGIWIMLVAAVSARQTLRRAVLRSTIALLSAVVAFYIGLKIIYGIRYPNYPYSINIEELGLWCLLALVTGTALGWAFHRIGHPGWPGAIATAAAIGLLLADGARRGSAYPAEVPVLLIFAVVAITVVLVRADTTRSQASRTALLVLPFAALGVALVSAPNVLKQLIFVGF